ncbi:sulfotransferase [Pseudaminobacter sp. 19-2017]|uniref:Sulfotransferase n=1 Tax=Pseudaminobacter soli (ex Zhang et al. 2022) TaxID=2831468 RepID=A0A942E1G9_9HYPH|nr:sulfotransferase [Pseudaminobacter soli]MBS3651676.1 sulfotransferase [Pseudaminobacter soli]
MTAAKLKPPIFLIGNYRSGTTITQKLIGLHPSIVTWYEPRTLWLYADPARRHDEFGERDATEKVVRYIRKRFLSFQSANGGQQIMENTPSNVLRVPYVHKIFPEAIFLYITRNPFSFISSMEIKWQRTKTLRGLKRTLQATPVTQLHHYAGNFIKQLLVKRVLRRNYIPIYGPRYIGINEDLKKLGTLRVIARQWARGNRSAREDLARLGEGRVLTIRYEDLMQDPEPVLRRIYDHCGLECSDQIVRAAKQMVDPTRQEKWLRLDPEKLKAILPEIQEEMRFYGYEVPPALR